MVVPRSFADLLADKVAFKLLSGIRRHARKNEVFRGIVVPVDDLIGERIMSTGMFESTHLDGATNLVSAPDTIVDRNGIFVDIGANIGLYSIALASRFRRCVAIEANPQTFRVLQANLALKDIANVEALCVGASDQPGEAQIHVPLNGNLGWATLNAKHHDLPLKAIPVTLKRLDDIIEELGDGPVSLLKIDVEGHELSVLRGARAVLMRDHPVVLFEVLNADEGKQCADLLTACGYDRFARFERGFPATGGRVSSLLKAATNGLPVNMVDISPADLHKAALVCAMKRPG